jgi:methionyl-tRNA formyltransferase
VEINLNYDKVKLLFAGKYCKNFDLSKFKNYDYKCIGEFEDYKKYLENTDIIISYGYGLIFKSEALKKKIFNIHPSILPYGRGIFSIVWSIYYNQPIGYTIYQINSDKIDEGLVYSSKEIEYDNEQTFKELFSKITKSAEQDFQNQSFNEVKDEKNIYYKNKNDSKVISKFLKNGWNTQIKDFLFYSKHEKL